MMMTPDKIKDLAAAYSLGALDGDDRSTFEKLLKENHPLAVHSYQEMQAITSCLPYAAEPVTPPAYLKTEILEKIETPFVAEKENYRPDTNINIENIISTLENKLGQWKKWAFAGGFAALLVLVSSIFYIGQIARDLEEIQGQLNLARFQSEVDTELIEQLRKTLQEKNSELKRVKHPEVKIYAAAPTADAPQNISGRIFFVPEEKTAAFYGFNLTKAADKDYQLWMIRSDGPVDAGLLTADEDGIFSATVNTLPANELAAFAVSLEPRGGSTKRNDVGNLVPTGPVYLVGAVTGSE